MSELKCREQTLGAVLYVTGFLTAGSMFIIIGEKYSWTEVDDSDEEEFENMEVRKFLWVYALAIIVALIGVIMKSGEELCDQRQWVKESECNFEYFGVLFQLLGVLGLSGSGMGMATFYDDSQNSSEVLASYAADERACFGVISGVSSLLSLIGFLFSLNDLICCNGRFSLTKHSILNLSKILFSMLLALFWFLWADSQTTTLNGTDDDLSKYSNLIGSTLLFFGFVGVLDCFAGKEDSEEGESSGEFITEIS